VELLAGFSFGWILVVSAYLLWRYRKRRGG